MGVTWNPFIDNLDFTGPGSTGTVTIPEYTSDPGSPAANSAWVLRGGSGGGIPDGTPIGLLLALTYTNNSGSPFTYDFSYRTTEGTTVRASLL